MSISSRSSTPTPTKTPITFRRKVYGIYSGAKILEKTIVFKILALLSILFLIVLISNILPNSPAQIQLLKMDEEPKKCKEALLNFDGKECIRLEIEPSEVSDVDKKAIVEFYKQNKEIESFFDFLKLLNENQAKIAKDILFLYCDIYVNQDGNLVSSYKPISTKSFSVIIIILFVLTASITILSYFIHKEASQERSK